MPNIDTLDALEEHEDHDDDYQTITNWNANWYTNLYAKQYFQTINTNNSVSWVKGGGVSLLQAPELLMNVNFEPIIRGLKSDIFDWDQV